MRKHSGANELIIRFELISDKLHIHYSDNGVGLLKNFNKGNGLVNTGNRIEKLGGTINFDLERKNGTQINVEIPFY